MKSKRLPALLDKGGEVTLSRNLIRAMSSMSRESRNLLVGVAEYISKNLIFNATHPDSNIVLENIPVPYDIVSQHHDPQHVKQKLIELMDIRVSYAYHVPGQPESQILTGIVSAISVKGGRYFVDIAPKAMPFLVYCGLGVGYGRVERNVFVQLPKYQQLVYLILCAPMNKENPSISYSFKAADIQSIYPMGSSLSKFRERVLAPLQENLNALNSRYELRIETILEDPSGRGNRRGAGYRATMTKVNHLSVTDDEQDSLMKVLERVYAQICKDKKELESRTTVFEAILENHYCKDFLRRVQALKPAQHPRQQAHKIAKLLAKEYGIQVFKTQIGSGNRNI